MSAVKRPLDQRRRNTEFVRAVADRMARTSMPLLRRLGLSVVTDAVNAAYVRTGQAYRSYDAPVGVLVVTAYSDLPRTREAARRILGREVVLVAAKTTGTVYQAKPGN